MPSESTERCGHKSSTSLPIVSHPFPQSRILPRFVPSSPGKTRPSLCSTLLSQPKKLAQFHLSKGAEERLCKIFATQTTRQSSKPRRWTTSGRRKAIHGAGGLLQSNILSIGQAASNIRL